MYRNDLNQFRYILQFLLIKCCEPNYFIQNHQVLRLLHWGLVYDFDSDTVFKFYYNFKPSHQVHVYSVDYQISLFFLFLGINFSNQHAYVVIYQLFDYIFDISMCCLFLLNLITVYS